MIVWIKYQLVKTQIIKEAIVKLPEIDDYDLDEMIIVNALARIGFTQKEIINKDVRCLSYITRPDDIEFYVS